MSEDQEERQPDPTIFIEPSTGLLRIDWHGPRPDYVEVQSESLEVWIEYRNVMRIELSELREANAEQRERIEAMQTLLTILRLGRRPARSDWASAKLPPLTKDVRMDLMSRKSR